MHLSSRGTTLLQRRKRQALVAISVSCLSVFIFTACIGFPAAAPGRKTAPVTPLSGGEPVLVHSQILLRHAPLPTRSELNFGDGDWTLPGLDGAATRSVTLPACCNTLAPAPAWFHAFGSALFEAPVVTKTRVYVLAADGFLHVLNAQDGTEQWRLPVGGEMTAGGLALAHGMLYLAVSGHYLAGINADTGQEGWRFDTVGPVRGTPLIIGRDVLVASGSNSLYCLDTFTGKEYWAFHSEDALTEFWPTNTSPAFGSGNMYVALGGSNEFNALSLRTGRKEWEAALHERMTGGPLLDEALGLVYVVLWSGSIVAFDAHSGDRRWEVHLRSGSQSSPALSLQAGLLYIGDYGGSVYALDARTGQQRWRIEAGSAVTTAPVVIRKGGQVRLFVSTWAGVCLMLDARTGQQRAQWKLGELRAAPIVARGILYQASLGDQGLYAFRL